MVRVVRLERTVSWSQRDAEHFFYSFVAVFVLFNLFYLLFGALISVVSECSGAVCGNLCGQKRFQPQTGDFFTGPGREAFRVLDWLDCNSEQGVMQVFSAEESAQSLRGYKQRNRGRHGGTLHENLAAQAASA